MNIWFNLILKMATAVKITGPALLGMVWILLIIISCVSSATPAPAESTPTPAPAESTPTPAPAESTPTPAPAESTPTPVPAESTPTPAPAESTPTPAEIPAAGTATPAPMPAPESTPAPTPAPAPSTPEPASTPTPATTPAPTPTPTPTPTPAPAPAPAPSTPEPAPVCPPGSYGGECERNCSDHCKTAFTCDPVSGACAGGCQYWYILDNCTLSLSRTSLMDEPEPSVGNVTEHSVTILWHQDLNVAPGTEAHIAYYIRYAETRYNVYLVGHSKKTCPVVHMPGVTQRTTVVKGLSSSTAYHFTVNAIAAWPSTASGPPTKGYFHTASKLVVFQTAVSAESAISARTPTATLAPTPGSACPPGTYGEKCEYRCSAYCGTPYSCDPVSGICEGGCHDRYILDNCMLRRISLRDNESEPIVGDVTDHFVEIFWYQELDVVRGTEAHVAYYIRYAEARYELYNMEHSQNTDPVGHKPDVMRRTTVITGLESDTAYHFRVIVIATWPRPASDASQQYSFQDDSNLVAFHTAETNERPQSSGNHPTDVLPWILFGICIVIISALVIAFVITVRKLRTKVARRNNSESGDGPSDEPPEK